VWQFTSAAFDYSSQLVQLRRDAVYLDPEAPRGNGEPILLIPGFLVGDWALKVMGGWLSRLGYCPYLSGIDWNVSPPETSIKLLVWRLLYIAEETQSPVCVVGHSLGGMFARVLGVRFPETVRQVITLGSPIRDPLQAAHFSVRIASLGLQTLWSLGRQTTPDASAFFRQVAAPLPRGVQYTAIFSKQDEIVDWQACLDPQGDSQQVSGGHMGLVVNRQVYQLLAQLLAANTESSQNSTSMPTRPSLKLVRR